MAANIPDNVLYPVVYNFMDLFMDSSEENFNTLFSANKNSPVTGKNRKHRNTGYHGKHYNEYIVTQNSLVLASKVCKRDDIPKITGYYENVFPTFIEEDFLTHYRVSKTVFRRIVLYLEPELIKDYGGTEQLAAEKQILIFLCYMSNQESMREVGHYFGVGKSTVHGVLRRVRRAFLDKFLNVISWPDFHEQQLIAASFQQECGLPGIIGILDGTHIRLASTIGGDGDYINRKGFPSMQLQVVCDDKLLIRHAYAGWPGCTHDARVLRNSSLGEMIDTGDSIAPNMYVIADSAYPLTEYLVTPFKDNGRLNFDQRRFNRALSTSRQTVERCNSIGHMKGRFRRIREITIHQPEEIVETIISAFILSNMCVLEDDDIDLFVIPDQDQDNHPNLYQNVYNNRQGGVRRRVQLMTNLP